MDRPEGCGPRGPEEGHKESRPVTLPPQKPLAVLLLSHEGTGNKTTTGFKWVSVYSGPQAKADYISRVKSYVIVT